MDTKTCPKCNLTKPTSDFYKNKARSDGISVYCRPCVLENTRATSQRLRNQVIDTLGGPRCARCGYDDPRALTIDHVDGGGTQHRADAGSLWSVYKHALEHPGEYQVLCWNCNAIKRIEQGEQPSSEYRERVLAAPRVKVTRPPRWARDYDACRKHGGVDIPVKGKGLCRNCYMVERRAGRIDAW